MLSKEHRIRKDQEVKRVFSSGKGVFDSVCGVKFVKNERDVARFAIVVGTKVSKSAVKRNRVKRQYREIVRLMLPDIKPGYDVVLLTSAKALELDSGEKTKRLVGVFKKAKLFA